jgi:DNA-binding Lrp family transcriptional regulator
MCSARKRIVPGVASAVKLDKHTLKALEKENKKAFRTLDKFVKAHNKKYASPEDQKYRIKESFKATAKCILQGFVVAAENNCLHGKSFETSTALIAHYVDATPRTIKRHIQRLKDTGIIVEQQYNPSFTFNNNYLIRLADWLIEDLYIIVEGANCSTQEQQETPEQTAGGTEQVQEHTEKALETLTQKVINYVENYEDEVVKDTPESWQEYLKNRFSGSG